VVPNNAPVISKVGTAVAAAVDPLLPLVAADVVLAAGGRPGGPLGAVAAEKLPVSSSRREAISAALLLPLQCHLHLSSPSPGSSLGIGKWKHTLPSTPSHVATPESIDALLDRSWKA
jgi:hypothetical protein